MKRNNVVTLAYFRMSYKAGFGLKTSYLMAQILTRRLAKQLGV